MTPSAPWTRRWGTDHGPGDSAQDCLSHRMDRESDHHGLGLGPADRLDPLSLGQDLMTCEKCGEFHPLWLPCPKPMVIWSSGNTSDPEPPAWAQGQQPKESTGVSRGKPGIQKGLGP